MKHEHIAYKVWTSGLYLNIDGRHYSIGTEVIIVRDRPHEKYLVHSKHYMRK